MSMSNGVIYIYTVEDAEGNVVYGAEYDECDDAEARAQEIGGMVIENEYEWADSSMVADYRAWREAAGHTYMPPSR